MTDYHKKLTNIQKQRQKLLDTEKALIEKRKREIADLAETFNLLTIDDKILANYFAHFKEHPYEPSPKASHASRDTPSPQSEICEAQNART